MRRFALLPLALIFGAAPAAPSENALSNLSARLAAVRSTHGANQTFNAGPELTPVKQALRAWIERQLPPPFPPPGPDGELYSLDALDIVALNARLNQSLDSAGLTCGQAGTPADRCGHDDSTDFDARGYLAGVRAGVLNDGNYLLIVTGVGIHCGFDESAYVYQAMPDRTWRLLLSSEQDRYGEHEYAPQNFLAVNAEPGGGIYDKATQPPLVSTLGFLPWCQSNWRTLYTRLWRTSKTTPSPRPLIDRVDGLFLESDHAAAAKLTGTEFLVEYADGSIDSDTFTRSRILHYLIHPEDKLERIGPVALGPNAFVEEWLVSDREEASHWTDPEADHAVLNQFHPVARREDLSGEFGGPAKRCRVDHALWQVSFAERIKDSLAHAPPRYFKVRWEAPYRFTLVAAGSSPFPGCDEAVTLPDDPGTLFPVRGWTP